MLPSRGLPRSVPASALRNTWSARTKPTTRPLHVPIRHFSQVQPRSTPLIRVGSRIGNISYAQTSLFTSPVAVAAVTASSVFAQRSGASRNLSLWPFSSKKPSAVETEPASSSPSSSPPEPSGLIDNAESFPEQSVASASASASTSTSTSPASAPVDHSQNTFSDLDLTSVLDIPEQIGYLKNLGLEFGWGPTSACEWVLEHVYIYTGMPWWATIAAVAVAWRLVLFWPTLTASKHGALLHQLERNPAYAQAKAEFNEAAWKTRDRVAQMRAQEKIMRLKRESGASAMRMFIPALTIPFSFCMFRLLRAMAALPVPSFETGGLAWFTDLAVHDPYYILPMTSIALTALMFKQTRDANPAQDPARESITKMMMYILPPAVFLGTAWLPAGIQWFFLTLSAGSAIQTTATLNPAIRRAAGLPPLHAMRPISTPAAITPTWQAPTSPSQRAATDKMDTAKKGLGASAMSMLGVDKEKEQWKKAQLYEERRAAEEKEKAYRRMEDLRRKQAEKGRL
ncbi:60Kd inner membrane protein-domain-containing protein [Daldinia caldariorum]|uniref:60Kd inner membrane protein-domain-containing protein n=1 Tax=Daldinia caldariorum TaxID=326644 RepID=UPI002007611A|nr:60Kd inner membrane protein-domain-containing protein [Daldinia caldariorum]KAI1469613.1 60Kd inner membrane protein-domain-containing protein [Daldinia caldariorum]